MKKLIIIGSNCIHTYNYYLMIKDFFDQIVIITNKKDHNFFYSIDDNIYYLNFSIKRFPQYLLSFIKLKNIIKKFKPNIIHSHQANVYSLFGAIFSKKFKIPFIITTWGSDILINPKKNFIYKILAKFVLKRANIITSDSLYMSYEIRQIIKDKNKKIETINFGVNVYGKRSFKKENIIFSNRLHKKLYRIDLIIKLFYEFIKEKNEYWELVIAGTGELTDQLKKLTNELNLSNYVKFVGWLDSDSNIEYYKKSKIFISIPESDATSISLLEAMNFGCIPIVSNIPANLEWIIDGLNGIVADNFNHLIFEKALKIDYERLININSFLIGEKASKETNKKKYIEIYEYLLER